MKIIHVLIVSNLFLDSFSKYITMSYAVPYSSGGTENVSKSLVTMSDSQTPVHILDGAGMSHSMECNPLFLQGKLNISTLMFSHITSSLTFIVFKRLFHNLTFPLVINPLNLGCLSCSVTQIQLQLWRHLHRILWVF